MPKPKKVIQDAPWMKLTYTIIGLAMQVHNELGPGHREAVYHDAMAVKLKQAGLNFQDEPYIPITLDDGSVVGGDSPDHIVEETVIVEYKARSHLMTKMSWPRSLDIMLSCHNIRWRCFSTLAARDSNITGYCGHSRSRRTNGGSGAGPPRSELAAADRQRISGCIPSHPLALHLWWVQAFAVLPMC